MTDPNIYRFRFEKMLLYIIFDLFLLCLLTHIICSFRYKLLLFNGRSKMLCFLFLGSILFCLYSICLSSILYTIFTTRIKTFYDILKINASINSNELYNILTTSSSKEIHIIKPILENEFLRRMYHRYGDLFNIYSITPIVYADTESLFIIMSLAKSLSYYSIIYLLTVLATLKKEYRTARQLMFAYLMLCVAIELKLRFLSDLIIFNKPSFVYNLVMKNLVAPILSLLMLCSRWLSTSTEEIDSLMIKKLLNSNYQILNKLNENRNITVFNE